MKSFINTLKGKLLLGGIGVVVNTDGIQRTVIQMEAAGGIQLANIANCTAVHLHLGGSTQVQIIAIVAGKAAGDLCVALDGQIGCIAAYVAAVFRSITAGNCTVIQHEIYAVGRNITAIISGMAAGNRNIFKVDGGT